MTAPAYRDYLAAVASLANEGPALAAQLAVASSVGQADLDGASRRVTEIEDESRRLVHRLATAEEMLTRMTHEVGLELVEVPARQDPPRSLVDADRLITDLQRELTAIDRNSDWVRTHRVARSQAAARMTAAPTVAQTALAVPASASPARHPQRVPMYVIGGLVAVVLVLVVILVLR